MNRMERILVIRHGALGDVVLSTGPFAAIRWQHSAAHITLLTTAPYAKLLSTSPYFNAIVVDEKPRWWEFEKIRRLKEFFRKGGFDRVYDLQTSQRSTWYYKLLPSPKPEFSGLAKGASHRHHTPERTTLHTLERQAQQLAIAGIPNVPPPDVSWLRGEKLGSQSNNYALLVPGGSAHRPEKRWPVERFIELGRKFIENGTQPVLIGTGAEKDILERIEAALPESLNLCHQTSFGDIAELARGAVCAVGNDTGPMHLIAATGCPCAVLFNATASNPKLCAPRGDNVNVFIENSMIEISSEEVYQSLQPYGSTDTPHKAMVSSG